MVKEFFSYDTVPILSYKELTCDKIFIGCIIKSRYDEDRIQIKETMEPQRLDYGDYYLYGKLFNPSGKYRNLIESIKKYDKIDLYVYNKELSNNNLSCEENFSYFKNGLYPIDIEHISDFMEDFKYDDFFDDNSEMPIYQRIKGVNLFLLIPSLIR